MLVWVWDKIYKVKFTDVNIWLMMVKMWSVYLLCCKMVLYLRLCLEMLLKWREFDFQYFNIKKTVFVI